MDPASSRNQRNRIIPPGQRQVMSDNAEDVRIMSSTIAPTPDPASYYNVIQTPTNVYPYNWDPSHSGYAQSMNTWDGYSQYVTPEGMHVPPVVYSDTSSLMYHPGYTYNPYQSVMVDGQIPISPGYYPQYVSGGGDNSGYDANSTYMYPYVQYGNQGNNLVTSSVPYPQTMGILGAYDHNSSQLPLHGSGVASSSSVGVGGYYHVGSYQNPSSTASYYGADSQVRLAPEIGRRREKEHVSFPTTNDVYGNRGPRGSGREKSINSSGDKSSTAAATAGPNPSLYNHPEFVTDYKNAKFFIVKSFSEDNVHRSIKYNVWSSTPHGNKKLDTAYRDAEKMGGKCPIFLFFSVNASGQFCGVAEMVGPVDFERNASYWQQDRWSGQFPVKWHILKDVPNNRFSHILLQNNDNKPVTHSRDSQEVKLRPGIEMLRIFKEYEAQTSIIDDFGYYDEREIGKVEDGVKREGGETSVEQLTERLQAVKVEDGKERDREES